MYNKFVTLFIAFFISSIVNAQTPVNLKWSVVLGGSLIEEINDLNQAEYPRSSIVVDADENVFVVCQTESTDGDINGRGLGLVDCFIVKMNSEGDTLWSKVFGGSGFDSALDIVSDEKGGCVITGFTYSDDGDFTATGHHGPNTERDGFVTFIDKDGKVVKTKQFGSKSWVSQVDGEDIIVGGNDVFRSIIRTTDGNYILCGNSNSTDGDLGSFDENQYWAGWLMKIDSNAKIILSSKVSYEMREPWNYVMKITDIEQANDGNIILLGEIYDLNSYFWWVAKIDINDFSKQMWSEIYSSNSITKQGGITKNKNGNYTVCGYVTEKGGDQEQTIYGATDIWTFTINDKDGTMGKQKTFGGSGGESPSSITTLKNGNILIGATTNSTDFDAKGGYGENDFWILELDSELDTLATYRFGGSDYDKISGIAENAEGNSFYIAGVSQSNDSQNFGYIHENNGFLDLWIGKIEANPTLNVNFNEKQNITEIKCIPTQTAGIYMLKNAYEKNISIFNIYGIKIFSGKINSDYEKLDLSKNNSGIYILDFEQVDIPSIKILKFD